MSGPFRSRSWSEPIIGSHAQSRRNRFGVIPRCHDSSMPRGLRGGRRSAEAVACLIARDGDCCWYCRCVFVPGKRRRTVDHAIPRSLGGSNRLENLRLACGRCNARKGSMTEDAYRGSRDLAERRRLIRREELLILGAWLPKRAYHHSRIQWLGERRWVCRDCHLSSVVGGRSPATVPCRSLRTWRAVAADLPLSVAVHPLSRVA
jgi:5-methylcytosine-specific restriction endonuclease McrA